MIVHESPIQAFKDGYKELEGRSRFDRLANAMIALCSTIELETWKTFPEVDSPEISREYPSYSDDEADAIIEKLLKDK